MWATAVVPSARRIRVSMCRAWEARRLPIGREEAFRRARRLLGARQDGAVRRIEDKNASDFGEEAAAGHLVAAPVRILAQAAAVVHGGPSRAARSIFARWVRRRGR
jgi:hypothetical protein